MTITTPPPRPALEPNQVGIIGSPSGTGDITIDIVERASNSTLLGDMVYMHHPLNDGRCLVALGTVNEIATHNRWHEDPNMRGVLRIHGTLPHLSADGDVRTANVRVQAVFNADAPRPPFTVPPTESGGALGMSPTTGSPVNRVDEALIQGLIRARADETVYLGNIFGSNVRLPVFIRDFTSPHTDGAFHTGIFGRTGSGKTALASYMLVHQLRHTQMSVLVFDPQGQFASEAGLPISPQTAARNYGRTVHRLSIAHEIQLPKDAPLMVELLRQTRFFTMLTMKGTNRDDAADEVQAILQSRTNWPDAEPADLLRHTLTELLDDTRMERIYLSSGPRDRVARTVQNILNTESAFQNLLREFAAVHSVFSRHGRTSLRSLLHRITDDDGMAKPYIIIDVRGGSDASWLDRDDTKARIMRTIAGELRRAADRAWSQKQRLINCAVIFDEAARFAPPSSQDSAIADLSTRLVQHVRETRKLGLGWTFITQEIRSLNEGIFNQLAIRAYGYGLTAAPEQSRLADDVGKTSVDLYRTFANPTALQQKVYPFMLSGPVSPLSFTAAPVFLEVATSAAEFQRINTPNPIS